MQSEYPEFELLKYEVMINHVLQVALGEGLIQSGTFESEGIFLRRAREDYLSLPHYHVQANTPLLQAVKQLNPTVSIPARYEHWYADEIDFNIQCFMTVNTPVIDTFLSHNPDVTEVPLEDGRYLQILASYQDLPRARRLQYAAFIVEESLLVVWDDEPLHICDRALSIIKNMTNMIYSDPQKSLKSEKEAAVAVIQVDEESGAIIAQERKIVLLNSIYVAMTLTLIVAVLGAGFREIAIEISVDHNMMRAVFVALTPIQVFFTLVSTLQSVSRSALLSSEDAN